MPSVREAAGATAPVHLRFAVPRASSGRSRSRQYVAGTTSSLAVTITPVSGGAATSTVVTCGATCQATLTAPVGIDTITLTLTDAPNGAGNTLSQVSTKVNVVANTTNVFNLTANPVVASIAVQLGAVPASTATTNGGTATDVPVTVKALDADGNVIVGPGTYIDSQGNPVTVTLAVSNAQAGGSGTVSLAGTTHVTSAGATINAHYDGGWLDHATITATSSSALVAAASPATLTTVPAASEYAVSASPFDITTGPDGVLWFTENVAGVVGRITTTGAVTEYGSLLPSGSNLGGVTTGPDGRVWVALFGSNQLAAITTSLAVSIYAGGHRNREVVTGPDGNIWAGENSDVSIDRMTPGGSVTYFSAGSLGGNSVGIASGPDGNIWYAEYNANMIGRITPTGTITGFAASGSPHYITAGPDGALWFTQNSGNCIGRITTSGIVTNYCAGITGSTNLGAIVTGRDGNLWFTESSSSKIARITPGGVITEFSTGISAGSFPYGLTVGPDGNLWFTEENGNRIGKFVL